MSFTVLQLTSRPGEWSGHKKTCKWKDAFWPAAEQFAIEEVGKRERRRRKRKGSSSSLNKILFSTNKTTKIWTVSWKTSKDNSQYNNRSSCKSKNRHHGQEATKARRSNSFQEGPKEGYKARSTSKWYGGMAGRVWFVLLSFFLLKFCFGILF